MPEAGGGWTLRPLTPGVLRMGRDGGARQGACAINEQSPVGNMASQAGVSVNENGSKHATPTHEH